MAQQTAVEWFWILLPENISKEYFDLFEQTKQMEKEQMKDMWRGGQWSVHLGGQFEKYYNETYNK